MGSGAAPRRIRSETLTPEESETELRHAATLNAWGPKKGRQAVKVNTLDRTETAVKRDWGQL